MPASPPPLDEDARLAQLMARLREAVLRVERDRTPKRHLVRDRVEPARPA